MKDLIKEIRTFKPSTYNKKEIFRPEKQLSFFVTDNCNLKCSYCYLPGKNYNRRMTFEVARKAIDYFLKNETIFTEEKLLFDFMGGEPLLEIDLISQVVDYFKVMAYKLNHRWFGNYRVQIATNGTLCISDKFKEFCMKNKGRIILSISLDGIKEIHDRCRVYHDGRGSYDNVIKGIEESRKWVPNLSIKSTISHNSIKYLKDSVIHLGELGNFKEIYSNLVYEDCWEDGDDEIYEQQLRELADYLIDNDLYDKFEVSYFEEFESIGERYSQYQLKKHWCNCGEQISISPEGELYPCTRFHELSMLSQKKGRSIGNVDDGIDFDKLRPFRLLNLENCSDQNCLECEIASGCGMCSGLSYDISEQDTIFSRTDFICKMHKARVRAREYYFGRLEKEKNKVKKKVHYYISQITAPRKVLNIMLASDSVNSCGYMQKAAPTTAHTVIDMDTLKKYIKISRDQNYFINFLYPSSTLDASYESLLNGIEAQKTKPYLGDNSRFELTDATVFVLEIGQELAENFSCPNVILLTPKEKIGVIAGYVGDLLKRGIVRVNIVLDLSEINIDFDFAGYKHQLELVGQLLYGYHKSKQIRYVNVLSDILNCEQMNNCNPGSGHITLGPDGSLYLCPIFYHLGEPLGTDNLDVPKKYLESTDLNNAPLCKVCDAFHCRRCVADNLKKTMEYSVPSEIQCVISHLEREVSRKLQQQMQNELGARFNNVVKEVDYIDPFKRVKVW